MMKPAPADRKGGLAMLPQIRENTANEVSA
jgi:hypothetical protein